MAGSYDHLCDDNGSFTFDLIENMGDAYEACEECHKLIGTATSLLVSVLDGDITDDWQARARAFLVAVEKDAE